MNPNAVAVILSLLFEWVVYSEQGLSAAVVALVPAVAIFLLIHRVRGINEEGYFLVVKLPLEAAIQPFVEFMQAKGFSVRLDDSDNGRRYDFYEVENSVTVIQQNTQRFPLPPGKVFPFSAEDLLLLEAGMQTRVFSVLSERGGRSVRIEPSLDDLPLPLGETSLRGLLNRAKRYESIAFVSEES